MISASSIYYSRTFTNIYLPIELAEGYSEDVKNCVVNQEGKYKKIKEKRGWDRNTFAENRITEAFLEGSYDKQIDEDKEFVEKVKGIFLNKGTNQAISENKDELYENFRFQEYRTCLLYTSPSPRDKRQSRMPSSA